MVETSFSKGELMGFDITQRVENMTIKMVYIEGSGAYLKWDKNRRRKRTGIKPYIWYGFITFGPSYDFSSTSMK